MVKEIFKYIIPVENTEDYTLEIEKEDNCISITVYDGDCASIDLPMNEAKELRDFLIKELKD